MTTVESKRSVLASLEPLEHRRGLAPELTPRAELVLLARALHREGYDEHLSGHITYRQPDGTLLVNPFELPWDEFGVDDVMTIDVEGRVLGGRWEVNPGVNLHLALHRLRDDVEVAVHNHPRYGTIWASAQRVPSIYDQTAAMVNGPVALYDQYGGPVGEPPEAEDAVRSIGDAKMALLAHHGVLVVAGSIRQAHLRAVTLEYRCRLAWHVEALGGASTPLAPDVAERWGAMIDASFPGLWEAMVRRELRLDPSLRV